MKTKIQISREIEITLASNPLFICYADATYYRFTDKGTRMEVLQFSATISTGSFSLDTRGNIFEHQIDIATLESKYAKQITEEEFNSALKDLLDKYVYGKEIVGTLQLTPEQQIEAEKEHDEMIID